jgi:hypothetical protein
MAGRHLVQGGGGGEVDEDESVGRHAGDGLLSGGEV